MAAVQVLGAALGLLPSRGTNKKKFRSSNMMMTMTMIKMMVMMHISDDISEAKLGLQGALLGFLCSNFRVSEPVIRVMHS